MRTQANQDANDCLFNLLFSSLLSLPDVKVSHLQPGESGGDARSVLEPSVGADFCAGREETVRAM